MMRPGWLALVVFVFTWSLTTHGKYSASGDESHYLMISHSIVADRDLDLANNYANDDARLFGHANLEIGLHAVPARDGRVLSIHDIGVGVVLVPAYIVARQIAEWPSEPLLRRFRMDRGLFTYSIVVLFLIALTTAGMVLVADGLAPLAGRRRATLLVLVAAVSPPIVSHAFLVFPEALALFVTSLVVWLSLKLPTARDAYTLLMVVLLLGALPWAHHKYLLYVPGLLFVLGWHRWALIRSLSTSFVIVGIALFVLPQVGLHAWTWHAWGTLGGALTSEGVPFSLATLQGGLLGLWLDRQSGLLAYAPLYWLVPACVMLTWRRTWPFLAPAALLCLPAAAFVIGWWAGFAPAARYLVPALPLFLVPFAQALRYPAVRGATVMLSVPQLLIDGVIWQHPRALWPAGAGNPALEMLGFPGRAYELLLAPVHAEGLTTAAVWLGVGWLLVAAVLVAWCKPAEGNAAGRRPIL
jgi:hypothetical protein